MRPLGRHFGASWRYVGASWRYVGLCWGILGRLGAILPHLGDKMRPKSAKRSQQARRGANNTGNTTKSVHPAEPRRATSPRTPLLSLREIGSRSLVSTSITPVGVLSVIRRPRRGFRRVRQLHQILCQVFCKSCRTLWSFPFEKALLRGLRRPLSGPVGAFRGNRSWAFSEHVGPYWFILALLFAILPILFAILAPRCPNIARKWSIEAELEANIGQHDLQDASRPPPGHPQSSQNLRKPGVFEGFLLCSLFGKMSQKCPPDWPRSSQHGAK